MWEYSINIKNSNPQIISYIFSASKKYIEKLGGVATIYAEKEHSWIILAVNEQSKEKAQNFLCKCLTKVICSFFKTDFLEKKLNLPIKDKMEVLAFKKALINFDKETDFYIISKNLSFDSVLYLESFYNFRLIKLRDKWEELISLANENKDYLINSESFFDLLKFLVDNIDINEPEIDIIEGDDGYRIFSGDEENSMEGLTSENLISSVIDLSPQKINLYCKKENCATDLIKRIYEKRVNLKFSKESNKECLTFSKI